MRLVTIALAATLFTIGTAAAAQQQTMPQPASHDPSAGLIYPAISSSYVGGTVPDMPLKEGPALVRVLTFARPQLQVKGRLALSPEGLIFVFNSHGSSPVAGSGAHFEITRCGGPDLPASVRTACGSGAGRQALRIPYSQLIELSRARVAPTDLAAATTAYASAAAGILSTVVGVFSRAHAKELYGGITAGTLALGYYFLISRPRAGDHYIALFICPPNMKSCSPDEAGVSNSPSSGMATMPGKAAGPSACSASASSAAPAASAASAGSSAADELFKKGDLMMFKIPNSHDYYNISMILSAKTGKTFVPETAETAGK
ncbi:MAG TPA: hypothetical protein VFP59_16860 [Candidatus Angelobacter sp.]|nr:hypothetical protein [Candidatus Angelobacter sp.]